MPMSTPSLPVRRENVSDVDWIEQQRQFLMEIRPSHILDDAFGVTRSNPIQPLPENLGQVVDEFEFRQRQVRESRPDDLMERARRRLKDEDDDDEKDQMIRALLGYIHVSH